MHGQTAFRRILSPGLLLLWVALLLSPSPSQAQGANSCIGLEACTGADLALIGNNSCNGDFACYYLHLTVPIVNSCNGISACQAANTTGLTMTLGPGSCNGFSACQSQNNPNPFVTIGTNSCNQDYACPAWHGMFRVDDNSCIGFFACQNGGGAVGTSSCLGNQACTGRFFGFTVNNRSCVGTQACAGTYSNILNDSCYGTTACFQTSSRIGNLSCHGDSICFQAQAEVPDCAFNTVLLPGCTNPELRITVTDGATRATQGTSVSYTIVASNQGLSTDPNASVVGAFPAVLTGCSITSVAAGGATGNDAGPTSDLNDTGVNLPPGSSVTYTASCNISPVASGTLTSTANVGASSLDPVPGNNSASDADVLALFAAAFGTVADSGDGVLGEGEATTGGATQILVDFNGAMSDPPGNATSGDVTDPANYRLFAGGPNGLVESGSCGLPSGDDVALAISGVAYAGASHRAALAPAGTLALGKGSYRLDVCATLNDATGYPIVATSRAFSVLGSDRLVQPNFDLDLTGWEVTDPAPVSLQWSAVDAGGATSSGSAAVTAAAGAGLAWQLSQCVQVLDRYFVGRLHASIQSSTAGSPAAQVAVEHFAGAGCAGASLGVLLAPAVAGDSATLWLPSTVDGVVPAGAQSARVAARVDGGAASSFVVNLDDLFYGDPETVHADGFE